MGQRYVAESESVNITTEATVTDSTTKDSDLLLDRDCPLLVGVPVFILLKPPFFQNIECRI